LADPLDVGKGYIYFFPLGMTEAAIVHLTDMKRDAVYSLVVHPLTGRVQIKNFYVQPPLEKQYDDDGKEIVHETGVGSRRAKRTLWPFVIRGHKPSMGHPLPFGKGPGVRAKLPVSRTLKSPGCGDCARGTIRRANAIPSPSPLPEGEGGLPQLFRRNSAA